MNTHTKIETCLATVGVRMNIGSYTTNTEVIKEALLRNMLSLRMTDQVTPEAMDLVVGLFAYKLAKAKPDVSDNYLAKLEEVGLDVEGADAELINEDEPGDVLECRKEAMISMLEDDVDVLAVLQFLRACGFSLDDILYKIVYQ